MTYDSMIETSAADAIIVVWNGISRVSAISHPESRMNGNGYPDPAHADLTYEEKFTSGWQFIFCCRIIVR